MAAIPFIAACFVLAEIQDWEWHLVASFEGISSYLRAEECGRKSFLDVLHLGRLQASKRDFLSGRNYC